MAFDDREVFTAVIERLRRQEVQVQWLIEPMRHTAAELSGKVGAKVADPSGNVIELKWYEDPTAIRPDLD